MIEFHRTALRAILTKEGWTTFQAAHGPQSIKSADTAALVTLMGQLHDTEPGDLAPEAVAAALDTGWPTKKRAEKLAEMWREVAATTLVAPATIGHIIRDYIKRETMLNVAQEILRGAKTGKLDTGVVSAMVQGALDLDAPTTTNVLGLSETGFPTRDVDRPGICSLGLSDKLDTVLGGGVAAGELLIFLAPPKRGKTSILAAVGAANAVAGKRVLHVTLEISPHITARRYDSYLSNLNYAELCVNHEAVKRARATVMDEDGKDRVRIVDARFGGFSPMDVDPRVESADLVILDYLEKMQPDRTRSLSRWDQRRVFGQVTSDAREMAARLRLPVITAWQVNREGNNVDRLSQEYVSECWDVIKHCDILIGIDRSREEEQQGMLRLGTILHRAGEARQSVAFHADFERCQFREV